MFNVLDPLGLYRASWVQGMVRVSLAPKAPRPKAEAGRSQIPAKGPEDAHGRVLSAVRTEWTQGESRRAGDENPELLLLCSNWPQQPAAAPRSEFSSEEGKTEIPNSRI